MTTTTTRPTAEAEAVRRTLARLNAKAIVIGHSRDETSRLTAQALGHMWTATGGSVLDTVDWPEQAASWLRQSRRFTASAPDAWVVVGRPEGWLAMGRRLAGSSWRPERTVVTAALSAGELIRHGAPGSFAGIHGVTGDGRSWQIRPRFSAEV